VHWFFDPQFTADSVALRAEEAQHFKSLRIRAGEEIAVTNGGGVVYLCKAQDPVQGKVSVESTRLGQRPKVDIQLVQAIAKGDRDELAIQASIELGCSSIVAWQAENSVSRWDGKEQRNLDRWRQIAISAMKQSQQAFLPEVSGPIATKDLSPVGHGVLLLPYAKQSLSQIDMSAGRYSIVVGPEGGVSDAEIEQLFDAGFAPYRLGDSVLRTSTAGPAAIAAIKTLRSLW